MKTEKSSFDSFLLPGQGKTLKNITNEDKIKIFYQWLGPRFKTFEQASEDAPISFLARDPEDKEYYIHVQIAEERSVLQRERTGIKIANTHFYHLYGMASQGMNMFWFEAFEDGYMLFYLNDCLTAEQLKVTDEFTMIGITSALHVEKPQSDNTVINKVSEPTYIQGSMDIQKSNKPKITRKKKKR